MHNTNESHYFWSTKVRNRTNVRCHDGMMQVKIFWCTNTHFRISLSISCPKHSFNIVTWYGCLAQKEKNKLNRVVNLASKIVCKKQKPLSKIHDDFVCRKAKKIIADASHPLFSCFETMPSGRRYRAPSWKRQIYKRSFIPSAIQVLNSRKICLW